MSPSPFDTTHPLTGADIRAIRRALHLSLADVAEGMYYSKEYIGQIEREACPMNDGFASSFLAFAYNHTLTCQTQIRADIATLEAIVTRLKNVA